MKVFSLKTLLGFLAALIICAAPAYAGPILDFGIVAPTAGTISFAGGANPLVGTDIEVDNVVGLGTVLNNGVLLALSNAVLNFTTGAHTDTWKFGGGPTSSITIVGEVPALGINTPTALLTGSFGSAEVFYKSGVFHIAGASFSDFKDEDLLDFYGLPTTLPDGTPMPYVGNFNISFDTASVTQPNPFTSTQVLSGDVKNTPVPEPGTLLLLGSGLMGLAGYGKLKLRRRKKA